MIRLSSLRRMASKWEDLYSQLQEAFAEGVMDAGENFQNAENTTNEGGVRYSLKIKHSNGYIEEIADARSVSDDKVLEYLRSAKTGKLYRDTYIPVRKDTPQVIIDTLEQVNEKVDNLFMVMQVRKARLSMGLDADNKKKGYGSNVRKHGLSPEEILEILHNLEDPSMIVYQTNRKGKNGEPLPNNVAVFVSYMSGESESLAVIEFESSINPDYIGKEYGDTSYHTVVTVFEPDVEREGLPFDYAADELLLDPNNTELKIIRRQNTRSATGEKHPNTSSELSSNKTLTQPETDVKKNDSAKIAIAAVKHFGKTYRWSETGYLLTDGSKLDFSGRHEGASGGYRTVDHRDILDIYPEDTELDGNGAMVDFMSQGNIRIMPEGDGVNLQVQPTKAQERALDDFISKVRGEVTLDIDDSNGNTVVSVEYPRGTRSSKVLQDIRNYFADGTEPIISSLTQFRYSIGSKTNGAVQALLEKENDALREDVARLTELLKLQGIETHGTRFTPSSVEAAARYLKKNAGAKGNTKELAKLLNGFYEHIAAERTITLVFLLAN